MSEVWVAAIGAAVTLAGTAYSISASSAAADAANSLKPKKFVPIDTKAVGDLALATDVAGYAASDADWRNRFPKLAQGRDTSISMAYDALRGKASPQVEEGLRKSGLQVDVSGNEFEQSRKLGLPILAKEQRDRTYFQKILADNPQRQFGLTGSDVTNIAISNTNSQSNYNQGLFGSRINQYNSQVAQSAQNTAGIVAGIGGAAQIGSNLYQNYQQGLLYDSLSSSINTPLDPSYYQPTLIQPYGGDNPLTFTEPNPIYSPSPPPPPPPGP